MNIIHAAKELKPAGRNVCLAIGFFDGVHLGHQQIIRQTIADAHQHDALALVLTFDRHPNTVVAPAQVPLLIYSLPQKLRAIESLGADALLLIHFDTLFSRQTGEEFIRRLAQEVGKIQSLCVGADFVFGRNRSGNVSLLKKLGGEIGFTVHGLAAVSLDGQVVSSTHIRELIQGGDLDATSQMLGRPYTLSGRVIRGNRLGQQLGFPTANLDTTGLILPPNGVYAGIANIQGKTHRAAINIGFRPTVASETQLAGVEAHLLNFDGNLYDEELELEIGEKLRKEKKFSSITALREQIARDIAAVAIKT
ncbi:MAG TPA: bifunctional riboflavin kinase/FAD synthetase [Candidatus Sulfopaludibacter sp.]|nr:bifunctional riboflavin kinase/FAD synthetase [Candidatus Sulfopaludibacter sp.]